MQPDGLRKTSQSKHATLIRIQKKKYFNVSELMEALFYFDNVSNQQKGEELLKIIRDETPRYEQWKELMSRLGITQGKFYCLMNKLIAAGMVRRKDNAYRIDHDFSNRLRSMADVFEYKIWRNRNDG